MKRPDTGRPCRGAFRPQDQRIASRYAAARAESEAISYISESSPAWVRPWAARTESAAAGLASMPRYTATAFSTPASAAGAAGADWASAAESAAALSERSALAHAANHLPSSIPAHPRR